ncbi:unnamed protein product [Musa acuminata subsp. burmannicoides]
MQMSSEEEVCCPRVGIFLGEDMVEEEAVRSSWVLAFQQAIRKKEEEKE